MRTPILMAAALAAGAMPVLAQNWGAGQTPPPEARLETPGVSFRAQVDAPPSRDKFVRGRLIAMGGGEAGAGAACMTCHGVNGGGDSSGAFPRLAEMPAWYMYKQLGDYAGGTRPNEIMTPIAQQLSAADREAVSVYYALTQAEARLAVHAPIDQRQLQWGAALNAVGSAQRGIPGCANCHAAEGEGIPPSVPALAGQHAGYIAGQLQLWKQGVRRNDPMYVMKAIADKMSDEDITAVSEYFARLQPVTEPTVPVMPVRPTSAR
jgi:cytochrome c553